MIDIINMASVDLREYKLNYNHDKILKEILEYYDNNCKYESDFVFTISRIMKSDYNRLREDILRERNLLFSVESNAYNTTNDIITVHIYKL